MIPMEDAHALTAATISAAALVFLYFPFARLRREEFRTDIRTLRDELFDFMWKNGYDFNSVPYRATRQALNGMIRMSNTLNPFMFASSAARFNELKKHGYRESSPLDAVASDPKIQEKILEIRQRAINRVLHFVFKEGLSGAIIWAVLHAATVFAAIGRAKAWLLRGISVVWGDAYEFGREDLSHGQKFMLRM